MNKHLKVATSLLIAGVAVSSFVAGPVVPAKKVQTTASAQTPIVWKLDKSHSGVKFTVTHLLVSEVDGNFKTFDGTFEHTKEDFSDAKITFTIDAASANTNNEGRDNHLKKADFFDVEKYPTIKFVSTSFKPAGGKKYTLTGQLTVKDVTKTVTFDVTYNGQNSTARGVKAGFKATTTIDRTEYNIKGGGAAVGDDVDVTVNIALAKA
ncbi:YceI family protein [Parasegetibacter sp. NRK P23]|uniref:YceI family protein n=1 Tax=Parasegetibacter sp. NRK P23 TaxID=2942999 RepID=UPI002042DD16|nr:YceI family protein [Parasegetibacter sp. NRK P23]MCM5527841.1 YceI family protein [Parasegetibacter sp. NRK P23]